MRTTIILNDSLVNQAMEYSGISEKTELLHQGLKVLIQRNAALRLAALGGCDSKAKAAPRRRIGT